MVQVSGAGQALNSDLVRDRGMVVDVPLPEGGTVSQLAHPIKYSATPPVYRRTGVSAGTHTQDVLREIGFAEDEVK